MTRVELKKKYYSKYRWLLKNNRKLLDKYFPKIQKNDPNGKKEMLLEMAKLGKDKPDKSKSLYHILYRCTNKKHKNYDAKFTNELKQLRPDWFFSSKQKSYKRMLRLMPSNIKFKEGQEWKGINQGYIFIHKEYGEFTKHAENIMNRCWKKGLSGHPKDGISLRASKLSKKLINLDTGEIFDSINIAAKKMKVSRRWIINICLDKNKTAKTYRWTYYNPDNHIRKSNDKT